MLPRKVLFWVAAAGALAVAPARADVKPHPLFTDNMVLQQGVSLPVFGMADPGEEVTVTLTGPKGSATAKTEADKTGHWKVLLDKQTAGTGFSLTAAGKNKAEFKNVAVGEVWVCSGQSNMEMQVNSSETPDKVKAESKHPNIRLFTVHQRAALAPITDQADLKHFEKWVVCGPDTVGRFSAVAYHFGVSLQKHLDDTPIGLIHTSWGGTPAEAWTSLEALAAVPELNHYVNNVKNLKEQIAKYDPVKGKEAYAAAQEKYKEALAKHKDAVEKAKAEGKTAPKAPTPPQQPGPPAAGGHTPAALYNAMIAPLLPYAVKGAIWYQGESNAGRAFEYRTLFATMIEDWRTKWKSDLPFMLVQLAPFMAINKEPQDSQWAELREAQYLATVNLKKVGMSVITDVGDEKDIHPKPKQPVGERLATAARALAYGEKVEPIGPTYKSLKVEGDKAVVTFDHLGGGLVAKGDKLTGFTVCGKDHKFHNAAAEIKGDTVVVTCPDVAEPVAVRFGWANFPVVNLWSKDGLPACPFRSDTFQGVTEPKKPAATATKTSASKYSRTRLK
ncbi:sialate O-acetylesterase [Fimbriiglobus ruber]|uniref:Sialic acid-specific 9-O-acetylesterase n=1 Tax=Fimbriiglobus ruber TaxID=1908690 RepID=A0A225DJM1_9BACT|nr:sialate O-acetylesterase [Fimbriiglobus ruber]OWK37636.1 Sialic acid-specific 9-O-acetylesterase [Fimbriiglobus ruber]